ncbi:MAG: hypothetical protein J6R77_03030, partial [Clostridia bacterium]|nr:hypothetical protein [Clostridia bacterium]
MCKSVMSVIFALALLLSLVPMAAVAESTPITQLAIEGFHYPTEGETMAENVASLKVPEGADYALSIAYRGTRFSTLEEDYVFQKGDEVFLVVVVYNSDGRLDANVTFTVNGSEALVSSVKVDNAYQATMYSVTYQVGAETISTVDIQGVTAPTAGQRIIDSLTAISLPADAPYTMHAYWTEGEYRDELPSHRVFGAGQTYRLVLRLLAKDGYQFAMPLQVKGDLPIESMAQVTAQQIVLEIEPYTLPGEVETPPAADGAAVTAQITGFTLPVAGERVIDNVARIQLPADAPYACYVTWHSATTRDPLDLYDTFQVGKRYFCEIWVMATQSGVSFTAESQALNGGKELVDMSESWGGNQGVGIVSKTVTVAEAILSGDVDGDEQITSTDARLTLQFYAGKV